VSSETLIERLRKRAEIRRQIPTRKSVQENKPDRIADLLEEAAHELESVHHCLRNFDLSDLIVPAVRYYLGRMTISVHIFCNDLMGAWSEIPDGIKSTIIRDIEEAFERDDHSRQISVDVEGYSGPFPLGDDCDRASWERVRAHYKKEE